MSRFNVAADKAGDVCERFGWDRGWSAAGCYLHLEVSEFIEALRGKGDSTPLAEAADVLFVLLSTCKANGMDVDEVVAALDARCEGLLSGAEDEKYGKAPE
jgi:NTP pyrophosphatase (non-canonical NTP hydrolase)